MLGAEFEKTVDAIVAKYPQPKAAILPVLWEVQKAKGYIDLHSEEWVASRLGVAASHVHGCVTFYTMYKQRPSGRHHIQVCTTLSCMLRGSDELVGHPRSRAPARLSCFWRPRPRSGPASTMCSSIPLASMVPVA